MRTIIVVDHLKKFPNTCTTSVGVEPACSTIVGYGPRTVLVDGFGTDLHFWRNVDFKLDFFSLLLIVVLQERDIKFFTN